MCRSPEIRRRRIGFPSKSTRYEFSYRKICASDIDKVRVRVRKALAPLQNWLGTNFPIEKYVLVSLIRLGLGLEGHWLLFKFDHRTNSSLITLHLPPPRPNLLPRSQFLPNLDRSSGKNLSTAPDKCVDHLRSAVIELDPLQNRPGTKFPIEKYVLVTLIRLGLVLEVRRLPFKIDRVQIFL